MESTPTGISRLVCTSIRVGAGLLAAAAIEAQAPTVSAVGQLLVNWQGTGPLQSRSQAVTSGSESLQVSTVATLTLGVGPRTTLFVDAASPPSNCSGCWSSATGDVVLQFSAPSPTAGVLVLDLAPVCIMTPSFVDVGLDGQWEVASGAASSVRVPVVLTTEPLPVRLVASAVNFGGATCRFTASVEFVPQPQNLGSLSPACSLATTASLTGGSSATRLLALHPASQHGPLGALLLGDPFWPQPVCLLLPNAEVLSFYVPTPTSPIVVDVAPSLRGALSLQYAELDAQGQVLLSNAVGLILP